MKRKPGDVRPKHLTDEQVREAWEKNRGLVYRVVDLMRPGLGDEEREDLAQAGMLGLHRALLNWNPARAALSTYASRDIRYFVAQALRRDRLIQIPKWVKGEAREEARKRTATVSLSPREGVRRGLQIAAQEDETKDLREAVKVILGMLRPRQRLIVSLVVMEGLLERQVADLLGVTREAVTDMKKRALAQLREQLAVSA